MHTINKILCLTFENNDLMQISAHASLFVPYRQAQNPAERKTLSQ